MLQVVHEEKRKPERRELRNEPSPPMAACDAKRGKRRATNNPRMKLRKCEQASINTPQQRQHVFYSLKAQLHQQDVLLTAPR